MRGLSPAEYYRVHGTLPQSCVEDLIVFHEDNSEEVDVTAYLQEAKGCFPSEDFLQGPIKEIGELAKKMRGDNRKALEALAQSLEEIQSATWQQSEYGADEIKKALKELAG